MRVDTPATIPSLVVGRILELELAALLWALVDGGMAVLVTGDAGRATRLAVLHALARVRRDVPAWDDDLVAEGPAGGPAPSDAAAPAASVRRYLLLARDGRRAGATMPAADLEAALGTLGSPPFGLSRDELGHLGIVVVIGPARDGSTRALAAHWLRPVTRDAHGHVQRFQPAVLGTWDPLEGRWEDFSWGVMPELAARQGRRAGDLEADVKARAAYLEGLASAGVVEDADVATALAGFVMGGGAAATDGPGGDA